MKNTGLTFEEAHNALMNGLKVRLPEWRGYWFADENKLVKALTKDGNIEDPWASAYMDRLDWEIAQGLDFGWAICALKAGKLVTRAGWNGKGMFVFRQVPATINGEIVPKMQSLPQEVKDEFVRRFNDPTEQINAIYYDNQLALVGLSNLITGWSPSVTDALAEDWQLFEIL